MINMIIKCQAEFKYEQLTVSAGARLRPNSDSRVIMGPGSVPAKSQRETDMPPTFMCMGQKQTVRGGGPQPTATKPTTPKFLQHTQALRESQWNVADGIELQHPLVHKISIVSLTGIAFSPSFGKTN